MLNPLTNAVIERLKSFGYEAQKNDEAAIDFSANKVTEAIKNDCNVTDIPEGLFYVAVDMAAGEFLNNKRVFDPSSLASLNVDNAVKSLSIGDISVGYNDSADSADKIMEALINCLLTRGKENFSCYRKIRW